MVVGVEPGVDADDIDPIEDVLSVRMVTAVMDDIDAIEDVLSVRMVIAVVLLERIALCPVPMKQAHDSIMAPDAT